METPLLAALWQALAAGTSRRAVVAGFGGGLLAAGPLAFPGDGALAGKRGKRRKRKRNRKRKNTAKTRVGATCPGLSDSNLAGFTGDNRLAQTFTATASGPLVRAEVLVQKFSESTGDFVLRLSPLDAGGVPTNEVLDAAIVVDARVPEGESSVEFAFTGATSLAAGRPYALVLTRPGGSGNFAWSAHDDTCEGRSFASLGQDAPFIAADVDLVFTAFVGA